ncbi:MAG: hypothetical protein R3E12_18650 [Candidatus Eisenbacteria bacterium]
MRAGLIGEYSGIAALQGKVYTVWTDTRRGNQDTYASYFPAVTGVQGAGSGATPRSVSARTQTRPRVRAASNYGHRAYPQASRLRSTT